MTPHVLRLRSQCLGSFFSSAERRSSIQRADSRSTSSPMRSQKYRNRARCSRVSTATSRTSSSGRGLMGFFGTGTDSVDVAVIVKLYNGLMQKTTEILFDYLAVDDKISFGTLIPSSPAGAFPAAGMNIREANGLARLLRPSRFLF